MKRPSFQFYPADWRKDAALQSCSVGARGLWIEIMCIAHECEPYGHLVVNGKPMSTAQIARLVGASEKECAKFVIELEDAGVCARDDKGAIFSRRMVKDEDLRERRAAGGKEGSDHGHKGASHGAKGGRPKKENPPQETPLGDEGRGVILPPIEPPPSSSTSVSKPPTPFANAQGVAPPRSAKRKTQTFAGWLTEIRSTGEKAISGYAPVWAYADKVGLPADWVELAWMCFRKRYERDEKASRKRYADWRKVFLNAVEGNWCGIWAWSERDQAYRMTTVGQQADREMREAA